MRKTSLPLIQDNYKWYDRKKGVAGGLPRELYIEGLDDNSPRVNKFTWFKNKATQVSWYTDPTFRDGAHTYTYREINPQEIYQTNRNEKIVRSSYIPYIKSDNDTIYWLLGSFHDLPEIKDDFGGKCERNESPERCATRELNEETLGVLTSSVKKALKTGKVRVIKGKNRNNSKYHKNKVVYFTLVDMTNLLEDLDAIQEKIKTASPITGETFGPLGFYRLDKLYSFRDHKTDERISTAFSLTDLIKNLRRGI